MLRSLMNGLILNIQFFSTIPFFKKEVPITTKYVRRAIQLFPILGLLQGIALALLGYIFIEWTFFSSLAIAFFLWLFMIVITGAIHLDGWIDSSDAYFSYRDQQKRVEILADPTIGAFGLVSTIVLLGMRFLFIYETVNMSQTFTFLFIMLIPFLGKVMMGWMITFVEPVKKSGNGYLFYKASGRSVIIYYLAYIIAMFSILAIVDVTVLLVGILMLVVTIGTYFFFKRKIIVSFGGMNGDLVGGATEGVETILWLTIWLYHYFAMGLH